MFKKRHLQVKIVKDDAKSNMPYDQGNEKFQDKVFAVNTAVKENVKNAVKLVAVCVIAYVAADTVRQVAVEVAKK